MSSPSEHTRYCPVCGAVYAADTQFCPKDGSQVAQSETILAGRFILKGLIGMGTMGAVHRAVQLPMGRQVAVKLLHAELTRNPEMVARFEREALAASTVDHPNAVTIYDSGRTGDGQIYIAMEYLDGQSLAALLEREGALDPARAMELWLPVVKAMGVAHRNGIIHRDLKPDNVFISRKASDEGSLEEIVKVLDFGIAKLLQNIDGDSTGPLGRSSSKTMAGTRLGTALYMAPEQLDAGAVGKYSDVYALGLILIEMLTGRLPWGASTAESDSVVTMMRLVTRPKPLRELCPAQTFSSELQLLLDDVLAIEPLRRPKDASELLKRLGPVPEARFLMRGSDRRADLSQMLPNSAGNSSRRSSTAAQSDDVTEPVIATRIPQRLSDVRAKEPAEPLDPSERHNTEPMAKPSTAVTLPPQPLAAVTLPPLPTPPAPPTALLNQRSLGGTETVREPTISAEPRSALPGDSAAALDIDTRTTLPRALPTAPATGPSGALLAPEPAGAARSELSKSSASPAESAPSLDLKGQSSGQTLRPPQAKTSKRLWLIVLGACLLFLVGYLLLGINSDKKPVEAMQSPGEAKPKIQSMAAAPVPPPTPPSTPSHLPPVGLTALRSEEPAAAAVDSEPSRSTTRQRRNEESLPQQPSGIQVSFRIRQPENAAVSCGTNPPRICTGLCAVSPGEQCSVRSPGYVTKRYKYEELERRVRRGRSRIDVSLSVQP